MDLLDLLAGHETLKSLLQHHSSKVSVLQRSAFFTLQLSHPYMTTRKTIALTRWTFVDKVMSLLFNMLSRLLITFLPRSKRLLILVINKLSYYFQYHNFTVTQIKIRIFWNHFIPCHSSFLEASSHHPNGFINYTDARQGWCPKPCQKGFVF